MYIKRDIFYYGTKPNAHPKEQHVKSLQEAKKKSTTEHFWIINEYCDYTTFDWDWNFDDLPDEEKWSIDHDNIWPSQHQKDSGTWLCSTKFECFNVYRSDVTPVYRKNIKNNNWKLIERINEFKFDYSWHPDPTDPPYIYAWGCKYYPVEVQSVIEYHVEGATNYKYMSDVVELLPDYDNLKIHDNNISESFDLCFRADPREPKFIYVWGNKFNSAEIAPTIEYIVPGATQKKYMDELVELLPRTVEWKFHKRINKKKFDLSWRPPAHDPPYIYTWGNKFESGELSPTLEYVVDGATEVKFMSELVPLEPLWECWKIHTPIVSESFDFEWRPGPYEPPYIYVWGNKYISGEVEPTIEFIVPGATQRKYMTELVKLLPTNENWVEKIPVDREKSILCGFDFSWRPHPYDPPYIYTWGNRFIPAEVSPTLEYVVPGATQRKYMTELLEVMPEIHRWKILHPVIENSFDFSWRPNPNDDPYTYVFGNTQYDSITMPTLEYHVPNATNRKYMDMVAQLAPQPNKFTVFEEITDFDFSWVPNPHNPLYIYAWGNQWNKPEDKISVQYVVTGATDYYYMENRCKKLPNKNNFTELLPVESFDYSWEPNPNDPPYIYVFGNQWYPAEVMPTILYKVDGAVDKKYINDIVAKLKPIKTNFVELIPTENFDYSWVPNPNDPPYIYVFGNQWYPAEVMPTITYTVQGATEKKYINDIVAKIKPNKNNFVELIPTENFDYSWVPNPNDPPYTYVFGNKWNSAEIEPTIKYVVKNSTEIKYINDIVAITKPRDCWKNTELIESFDYTWRPHPNDKPINYQFGTQWAKTNGPTYVMESATDTKYVDYPVSTIKQNRKNWEIPESFDTTNFDFSWHPDSTSPPYIYQFGTVVDDINLKDGPKYITPNHNNHVVLMDITTVYKQKIVYPKYYIETTLEDLISKHSDEIFWALRNNINYENFNFDWEPTKDNLFVVNTFGSPDSEITQTYLINGPLYKTGYTGFNYIESTKASDTEYLSELFIKPEMFYIDKGNNESTERFEKLKLRFPNIQKTRFLNSWVETINRCLKKATTELCWILNSELDYSNFEFNYYPNPWQMKMVHVFGTQWNHWGTTYLVNREKFPEDTKYIKIIEHLNTINFVKNQKAIATTCLFDILLIDYGNDNNVTEEYLKHTTKRNVIKIPYSNDLLETFKNFLSNTQPKKEHYLWVCSTICNYEKFDFSYIPDPFSLEQLHVFPSDRQKYGDTFFLNVNKLRDIIDDLTNLSDIENINFNERFRLTRLPCPNFVLEETQNEFINIDYDFPYASFVTKDNQNLMMKDEEPISLWQSDKKNILVTSTGGTRVVIPKLAKSIVKDELYDYPYIIKSSRLRQSKPLDIIFLSNNEVGSEENWQQLLQVTKGSANRIRRIDGVIGRVQAYQACANESQTPWFFTVFAKLKVNKKFDWSWQPDRLQKPKHYIFYATNPVNGLEYGHQAMIAYNKKLTLGNNGVGLDFTLDSEHEVVELNSGIANYNTDSFSTWRTAFRECIKLSKSMFNVDKERLNTWLTVATGDFAQMSLDGARHAVEYYEEVNGDLDKLRLSYEWEWCRNKFESYFKK